MMKHFAIIELENDETPMVGVIQNVPNSPQGVQSFRERFQEAIKDHFDIDPFFEEDFNHDEIPDLFVDSLYEDVRIEIDGLNYTVRIIETWFY